jgi:protein-L-isoaspartate(D-aspartate) O-methyltransferase
MAAPLASDYVQSAATLASQLHVRGAIHSSDVYEAFRTVPRHLTIPRYYRSAVQLIQLDPMDPGPRAAELIYSDRSLMTHHPEHDGVDSRAARPTYIAHVLEVAELASANRVLHVGAGIAYASALIAHVGQQATVAAVDCANPVAHDGADSVDRLGLRRRVHYYQGDGYSGCEPEARFDRVIVTTGVTGISPMWLDQLTDDGFIVAPVYAGGLFPLMVIRRSEVAGELIGRPVLAHAAFGPASGLLCDESAISTPPPISPLPPAEHTGHVPALTGVNEDGYLGLWLYLAAADQRITAARSVGLDAEERKRAVLIGQQGAAAIAPDVIATLGPEGPVLAQDLEWLVEQWQAAGQPRFDAWEVRLRLNAEAAAALYTPARWLLNTQGAP